MPDVTLPTPGEVEEMRRRHESLCWCQDDYGHLVPMCDVARLLALVDQQRISLNLAHHDLGVIRRAYRNVGRAREALRSGLRGAK